jgi:hypothetical protein
MYSSYVMIIIISCRDFANEIIDGRHDCNPVQSTSDEWQLINVVVSHADRI